MCGMPIDVIRQARLVRHELDVLSARATAQSHAANAQRQMTRRRYGKTKMQCRRFLLMRVFTQSTRRNEQRLLLDCLRCVILRCRPVVRVITSLLWQHSLLMSSSVVVVVVAMVAVVQASAMVAMVVAMVVVVVVVSSCHQLRRPRHNNKIVEDNTLAHKKNAPNTFTLPPSLLLLLQRPSLALASLQSNL